MVNAYDYDDQIEIDTNELMQTLETSLATNATRASREVMVVNKEIAKAKRKIDEINAWAEETNRGGLMTYCASVNTTLEKIQNVTVSLYRIVEQDMGLFANIQGRIQTYEKQLETIAYELEYLQEAIAEGDTESPALENIMRIAREETEAEAKKLGYDTCHYNDITDTAHHIRYHNLEGDETTAIRLLSLVTGNLKNPTHAEIKAFKNLVDAVNNSLPEFGEGRGGVSGQGVRAK